MCCDIVLMKPHVNQAQRIQFWRQKVLNHVTISFSSGRYSNTVFIFKEVITMNPPDQIAHETITFNESVVYSHIHSNENAPRPLWIFHENQSFHEWAVPSYLHRYGGVSDLVDEELVSVESQSPFWKNKCLSRVSNLGWIFSTTATCSGELAVQSGPSQDLSAKILFQWNHSLHLK